MRRKFYLAILILILTLTTTNSNLYAAESLRDLFWKKSWTDMEVRFKTLKKKTAGDYSLMANAYRFQERWQDAVNILEDHAQKFPENIKPYADMTLLLGYEKTNQKAKALSLAESLYTSAPKDLKYYVAFAQYRLYDAKKDTANMIKALNFMLSDASTDEQRISTLKLLMPLTSDAKHALQLLELDPDNKEAASILTHGKLNAQSMLALGIHYFTIGNNSSAVEYLNRSQGRKAQYYRAWANEKLKRSDTALNLWGSLAVSGNEYAGSSVTRIARMARNKNMRAKCVNVLERVARERRGNVQARALQALISLQGKGESNRKRELETQLIMNHPSSTYAFNILWSRAWNEISRGNYAEAVKLLKYADAPGVFAYRRARILYWLAHSQNNSGQKEDAERTLAILRRKFSLTIYGLLSEPSIRIINGTNPNLTLRPSELEQWGFIYHAYMKLKHPKANAREIYRSVILSKWLGLESNYTEAKQIENLMTWNSTHYRSDLEALYPRAFKNSVDAASRRYGVENNFVWAIMRQESAFNPNAKSHAGAAGLMQLMPGTAKDESKRAGLSSYSLYNPNDNIMLGTSHLAWLSRNFAKKEYVMAAYNAGSGNARKWLHNGGERLDLARWIERISFEETSGYVQRVSGNLEVYRMLYRNGK
ncbi:MAG: transglycosylase SLT domain-containing protein [Synergistaceae bacterium]|nr:transglycosylase SLT domain-containing protein [Synergistaceae bacterium]MBQ3694876.1 transglycosylase SLT domain-containing protein [Synergistaceae bacterium]MBQ6111061.1 transglycosylase SLT domain-containing protein [Synergistaceae bacterium]MBR0250816.1 transglycosylase SLT domain-containing protein [Synergistaceae bacterium]